MNINNIFLRRKIVSPVIIIVAVGIILSVVVTTVNSKRVIMDEVEKSTLPAYRDTVFDALATMMTNGTIKKSKGPFLAQMTYIADLRVIRADSLDKDYGKGGPDDYAKDNIEKEVIKTGVERVVIEGEYIRGVYPYIAKADFMGNKCLSCHVVSAGTVLGAISIKIPLNASFAKIRSLRNLYFGLGLMGLLSVAISTVFMVMKSTKTSEQRYRDLFDSTLDGIYQVNTDGFFTRMNIAGAKIFGHETPNEIIGKHALKYWIEPKDREVYLEELRVKKTLSAYPMKARRKNGEPRELETSSSILEDTHGAFLGIEGILRDVTERKHIEEQILEVKNDWEDTFNSITDMITIHDYNFNIINANKSAERILGLPLLDTASAKCFAHYHGTQQPPDGCQSCQCLTTGIPATFEAFEPHLNMFIEMRAIPRFNSNNQVIGMIHITRDITERKKSEKLIQRQLEKLSALRTIDTAITSNHDLQTTLDIFINQVMHQLHVDAANVLLLNRETGMLEYASGQGFLTNALKHSHVRLGEGYAGVAALEKRIVKIPDLRKEDNAFTRLGLLKAENFVEYYGLPLVTKGHVIGVLEILNRSINEHDDEWFEFFESLAMQVAIAIDNNTLFFDLERTNAQLIQAYETTIEGWSHALDQRDKETEGHSLRVTDMTLRVEREMGTNDVHWDHVRRGALLHDIGKIGIPDNILLKPGPLSDEEWKIMRLHPVYSYELLSPINYLKPAIDIPYCHHEKWDGSGYPRGLKGEQIPLSARIFTVVDVWDALRSDRPYRSAWSVEKTREYIQSASGIQFDPNVVGTFLKMDW
jgi:PAS domain S-box-containing protein